MCLLFFHITFFALISLSERLRCVPFLHMMQFRTNGPIQQPFSSGEVGSPPSGHDLPSAYPRPMTKPLHFVPHFPQNSPSRLGQQPVQRFNPGRSTAVRGTDWNHSKVQPPPSSSSSGVPHSPGNSLFSNGRWGNY